MSAAHRSDPSAAQPPAMSVCVLVSPGEWSGLATTLQNCPVKPALVAHAADDPRPVGLSFPADVLFVPVADWSLRGSLSRTAAALSTAAPAADQDVLYLHAGVTLPPGMVDRLAGALASDPRLVVVCPHSARMPFAALVGDACVDALLPLDSVGLARVARIAPFGESPVGDVAVARSLRASGGVVAVCGGLSVDDRDRGALELPDAAAEELAPQSEFSPAALAAASGGAGAPVLLHITHNWGGGIERWLKDYCAQDAGHQHFVLRSVVGYDGYAKRLELWDAALPHAPMLQWDLVLPIAGTAAVHLQAAAVLDEVVTAYGVSAVLVSSLLGHSLDVLRTGLPTVFVVHDYYPFCPAVTTWFGEVCSGCGTSRLASCLQKNEQNLLRRTVVADDWMAVRDAFAAALAVHSVRVVAPSRAALQHLGGLFSAIDLSNATVIENGLDDLRTARMTFEPSPFPRRLRIVIPGRLSAHKGLAVFEALHQQLADRAEFILLGCGDIGRRLAKLVNVTVVADYERGELPRLVALHRPDCALFLSIWPETFSYTLSEMIALDIVPVARRIGAFAERIAHGETGLLFDTDTELVQLLGALAGDPERLTKLREGVTAVRVPALAEMVAAYDSLFMQAGACAVPALPAATFAREQHRRHAQLMAESVRQSKAVAELNTVLHDTGARVSALESALHNAADERNALDRGLAETRNALETERAVREAMEQSTSWKITGPLRDMKNLILRLRLLGHAVPAALRHAGGPLGLAARGWNVFRRGGLHGVRRALRDFAIVGQMERRGLVRTPTPPGADARTEFFRTQFDAANRRGEDYVAPRPPGADVDTRIRAVAFYLPQFHPIPENDAWWGKGFTEWTNVSKALPQFAGHYQPRLPADLGFYDLRVKDVMRQQIELARRHGIEGFCFYHYWFSGRRLLETPVDSLIADKELDFPFCLCWANENWTRRWDGSESDILMGQEYTEDNESRFIQDLLPYLRDERYMRVEGRPLILIYRIDDLPDPRRAVAHWREECEAAGLGNPYLLAVQSFDIEDPRDYGVDGAVEFPPHKIVMPLLNESLDFINPDFRGWVQSYDDVVDRALAMPWPKDFAWYRGIMPSWDNEARKPGRGTVFHGASPGSYARWLAHICAQTDAHHPEPDRKLVFINAWNEWAEGAYLEPDRRFGHAYLNATSDVLQSFAASGQRRKVLVVTHDAVASGAQLLALNIARSLRQDCRCEPHILLCGDGPLREAYAREAVLHDAVGLGIDARRALIARLREAGVEEAICNTSAVGIVVEELAAAGIRCISLVHEMPELLRSYRLEPSIAKIALHADKVVFPAAAVRDAFVGMQPVAADKQALRPQGIYQGNPHLADREAVRTALRAELGLSADVRIVLGVGYADPRKGIDLFAATAAIVCAQREDVRFVWVGGRCGTRASIVEFHLHVEPVIAAGHLVMAGPLPSVEAQRHFAAADAYFLSSREDPFPSVVLEAINAGMPVVAFDGSGGAVELVEQGFGETVPMADVDAAAQAVLRQLARSGQERAEFAERAKQTLFERFGFGDYVADLLALLGPRPTGVSVLIPNYNYARHLPERIRSVLAQTVRPREIILLDDASTDASVAVAERELARGDIPWRIVRNEANAGCYAQWQRGLALARNDIVWIAEADDSCEPNFLETLLPAFDDADVVLAYCQSRQIDEEGRQIAPDYLDYTRDLDPQRWTRPYVRDGADEIREVLAVKNTIPNASAVLMRKPDLAPIAPRLEKLNNAGDWLVYLHLLRSGSIAYYPLALNAHRRHAGGLTMQPERAARLMFEIVAVQRFALAGLPADEALATRIARSNQQTWEYLGLDRRGCPRWDEAPELASASLDESEAEKESVV